MAADGRIEDARDKGLLDAHEAAEMLGVEVSTIRAWTCQRRIPAVKLFGRAVRYRRHDLERLIARSTRSALKEYEARV